MKKKKADVSGVVKILEEVFPHGHPDFIPKSVAEMKLHSEKNHDYAFGGDALGNFKRVADILSHYPGLKLDDPPTVALIYMLKQLDAYLWIKSNGHAIKVEGIESRLGDVSVYSKLINILEKGQYVYFNNWNKRKGVH